MFGAISGMPLVVASLLKNKCTECDNWEHFYCFINTLNYLILQTIGNVHMFRLLNSREPVTCEQYRTFSQ